jgi:hypothetical protein
MKSLEKLLEYISSNKQKYSDEEAFIVENFIKNDKQIRTGVIENSKIYGYPFLSSVLDVEKSFFDITDEVEYFVFLEKVCKKNKYIEIEGFSYFSELSIIPKMDISYKIINKKNKTTINAKSKVIRRSDLQRLSNGIIFYENAGFSIKLPLNELKQGEYKILIFINGLIKESYFFDLKANLEPVIDFEKTGLNERMLSYFITLQILESNKIIFKKNISDKYINIPNINVIAKVQRYKIRRFYEKQPWNELLDFSNLFKFSYSVKFDLKIGESVFKLRYLNFENELDYDYPNKYCYYFNSIILNVRNKNNILIDKFDKLQKELKLIISKVKLHSIKVSIEILYNKLKKRRVFGNTPVDSVRDKIELFEKNTNILDLNLMGVYVWQIGRFFQYNNIYNETGVLQNIFAGKKRAEKTSNLQSITPAFRTFSYESSPFSGDSGEIDEFIIDNLRKIKYEDKYIDPNSQGYIDKLEENKSNYLVCEDDYLFQHFIKSSNKRKYLDGFKRFSEVYSLMKDFKINFSEKHLKRIDSISKEYMKIFNLRKTYNNNLKFWLRRYIYSYTYYYNIFHYLKPKTVTVVGPYRSWIFKAAKDLNIYTKELQYAAIESNHPAYNFNMKKDYLPDEIVLWGSYWIEELKERPYKFSLLQNDFIVNNVSLIRNSKKGKFKYDFVYLSQGTIGKRISDIAIKHKEEYPEDKILFRLHPHESLDLYPDLKKVFKKGDIDISHLNDETLYQSIDKASIVLGVYSTSLIESYAAGKHVGILNLPGIFYMEKFIKKYNILVLDSEKDIKSFRKKLKAQENNNIVKELFHGY